MSQQDGLFWVLDQDGAIKTRGKRVKATGTREKRERIRPPVPDTGWTLPENFPSLKGAKRIAIDVETHDDQLRSKGKGPGVRRDGYMVGLAVATDDWSGYYPFAHKDGGEQFDKEKVLSWANAELSRRKQPKHGANLLYDLDYLTHAGVKVEGPFYDCQVAEPLIDENSDDYSLDGLAIKYLGHRKVLETIEKWGDAAFGKGQARKNIWQTPPSLAGPMAQGDVELPLLIFDQQKKIMAQEELGQVFDIETRLIPALLAMRQRGVRVDLDATTKLAERFRALEYEQLEIIKETAGYKPDIWAADSIATLFDKMGIKYPSTEKGNPSFRKGWLEKHAHPVAQLLMKARKANKFRTTFLEGHILGSQLNGRIHCLFHQLKTDENGTVSGRLSSSSPNLQNIPIRDRVFGPLIRSLFLPDEGELWGARDWSQVEYRLLVHFAALMGLSGVQEAVDAYLNDYTTDFHQYVAELTGLSRPDAKNFNFGMVYGQGIELIAHILGISLEAAQELSDVYHGKAPYIRELSRSVQNTASKRGFLKTLLGRRRRFPVFEDREGKRYKEDAPGRKRGFTHKGLNALIQGSAADIMKLAMVEIHESGVSDELGPPLLTVHDELGWSVPKTKRAKEALKEAHRIMEHCVELKIPLLADGGEGINWAEAKEKAA